MYCTYRMRGDSHEKRAWRCQERECAWRMRPLGSQEKRGMKQRRGGICDGRERDFVSETGVLGRRKAPPQPCGGMGLSAGGREGEQKQMMDMETPGWAARNRGSQVTETH